MLFRSNKEIAVFYPGRKKLSDALSIEYILNLRWEELDKIDLYKIMEANFPSLKFSCKEEERRRIRNLTAKDPFCLSNDKILYSIETTPKKLTVERDPLYVKKSVYRTPIRYRGQ